MNVNTRASKTNTFRKGAPPLDSTIRFNRRPSREGEVTGGDCQKCKDKRETFAQSRSLYLLALGLMVLWISGSPSFPLH